MSVAQSAAHIHHGYCRPGQSNPNTSRAQTVAIGNDPFQQDTYISRTKWAPVSKNPTYVYFSRHVIFVEEIGGTNYVGVPSVDTVDVTDFSLDRIVSALRVPSTDTATVADSSLTRMKSAADSTIN